ncbi:efflux RND transporter periplasmic adaptor subunit [Chitinophaga pendula]|uniref:efflux RND transporter periplasmic adaptor subunit n=1 Tax=Chitinophaga TaxID=79328 RepID=UPI000BAED18E|nr:MULTISPECIES: efflux RND transporter periplasmic adaptor subunit [Chitinophaga]ASZ13932.1 efflux transporter periplasmic adaptor subunit [Chitinophaga sp. MD30]UCJ08448.1 efflux RND transporter periplasmic adaptor subunit [Chitinophaga pendula]
MKPLSKQLFTSLPAGILYSIAVMAVVYGCSSKAANPEGGAQPAQALPVLKVTSLPGSTHRDYTATLEGKVNVEIRPQVSGYLERIYVDEGAFVKAGQPLFKINDRPFQEQLSNATASLLAAQANLQKAELEVNRLTPLVQNNVVSDIQLKTAQAALQAAKASVSQAQAVAGNARINLGYTLINAPVSGYIGRIPFKTGALVGSGEATPLTLLSDVNEVYAYFSMSEVDFIHFKEKTAGNTIQEKVKNLPQVELVLADNSVYSEKGRIETMEGQFDKTMGAISFRATFPNAAGLLRSGNTGRVRLPQQFDSAVLVPQEATFELQDKVFVFAVGDSNKVSSKPITVAGKSGGYYFVGNGLKPGERIVYTGLDRLQEGAAIKPEPMSMDSLLKSKPLN